jgi:hypothetical protein
MFTRLFFEILILYKGECRLTNAGEGSYTNLAPSLMYVCIYKYNYKYPFVNNKQKLLSNEKRLLRLFQALSKCK